MSLVEQSPETLPVVPLRDMVVFPHMMAPFIVGRENSVRALEAALTTPNRRIYLVAQRDPKVDDPLRDDLFENGVVARVVQNLRLPNGATLWATTLDGTPIEVRKQGGDVYAVPLTGADGAARTRVLKLVYGNSGTALGLSGRIEQQPPLITALSGQGTAQPVEILARTWTVHAPDHAAIIASHGAFQPTVEPTADSLLGELLKLIRFPTGQSRQARSGPDSLAWPFTVCANSTSASPAPGRRLSTTSSTLSRSSAASSSYTPSWPAFTMPIVRPLRIAW